MNAIWRWIKREPVVLLSLLVAILDATEGVGWRQGLIVALGLIARQFTIPTASTTEGS